MQSRGQLAGFLAQETAKAAGRRLGLLARMMLAGCTLFTGAFVLCLTAAVEPGSASQARIIVTGTVSVGLRTTGNEYCFVPYPGVTVTALFHPVSVRKTATSVTAVTGPEGHYKLRLHQSGSWTISTNNPSGYNDAPASQSLEITSNLSDVDFTYDSTTTAHKCKQKS